LQDNCLSRNAAGSPLLTGFDYNKDYIRHSKRLSAPLYKLLNKGKAWEWTAVCNTAFNKLKSSFTLHKSLRPFNPRPPTRIKSWVDNKCLQAVLYQRQPTTNLWLAADVVQQQLQRLIRKGLVAAMMAFATVGMCQRWQANLSTCAQTFELLTDSMSGKRFTNTTKSGIALKALLQALKEFDLKVLYFDRDKPIRTVLPCWNNKRLVGGKLLSLTETC
jgi:hypothetical protein